MESSMNCSRCNKGFCGSDPENVAGWEKIVTPSGKREWHCRQCLLDLNMAKLGLPQTQHRPTMTGDKK